jgi:hypothetical protein
MATTFDWTALTWANLLTTELNSLGSTFSTASSVINNTAQPRQPYIALELFCASFSPGTNPYVEIYWETSTDNTNFSDHGKPLQTAGRLMTIPLDTTASSAQRLPIQFATILPVYFKIAARYMAGSGTLAATGNVLKYALAGDEGY